MSDATVGSMMLFGTELTFKGIQSLVRFTSFGWLLVALSILGNSFC